MGVAAKKESVCQIEKLHLFPRSVILAIICLSHSRISVQQQYSVFAMHVYQRSLRNDVAYSFYYLCCNSSQFI